MSLSTEKLSLKSFCLVSVVTQGELSCLVPSPLPELPHPLDKELELITVTGPGPVKLAKIQWTWPRAPCLNSMEFSEICGFVQETYLDSDYYGTVSRRTGMGATQSGMAEVWRPEAGTWSFLHNTWRLGRYQHTHSGSNLNSVIEKSSIVHRSPDGDYTSALRFFKEHVITEEGHNYDSTWSCKEKAFYNKVKAIKLPEDEDTGDWSEEDWDRCIRKENKEEALMNEEDRAVEDGWAELAFPPELQPLSSGAFLATSVEYSWPGLVPGRGDWRAEELSENLFNVPKVVKVSKKGKGWQLLDCWVEQEYILLTGEGDCIVRSGNSSMRILDTGELLLTRKSCIPGMVYGGPDFRAASYTFYSPV